jgi:hypothetical protein
MNDNMQAPRDRHDSWSSVCGWIMTVIVLSAIVTMTGAEILDSEPETLMCEAP